jgi:hypothetical protein
MRGNELWKTAKGQIVWSFVGNDRDCGFYSVYDVKPFMTEKWLTF